MKKIQILLNKKNEVVNNWQALNNGFSDINALQETIREEHPHKDAVKTSVQIIREVCPQYLDKDGCAEIDAGSFILKVMREGSKAHTYHKQGLVIRGWNS